MVLNFSSFSLVSRRGPFEVAINTDVIPNHLPSMLFSVLKLNLYDVVTTPTYYSLSTGQYRSRCSDRN